MKKKRKKTGAVSIETILVSAAMLVISGTVVGTVATRMDDVNQSSTKQIDKSSKGIFTDIDEVIDREKPGGDADAPNDGGTPGEDVMKGLRTFDYDVFYDKGDLSNISRLIANKYSPDYGRPFSNARGRWSLNPIAGDEFVSSIKKSTFNESSKYLYFKVDNDTSFDSILSNMQLSFPNFFTNELLKLLPSDLEVDYAFATSPESTDELTSVKINGNSLPLPDLESVNKVGDNINEVRNYILPHPNAFVPKQFNITAIDNPRSGENEIYNDKGVYGPVLVGDRSIRITITGEGIPVEIKTLSGEVYISELIPEIVFDYQTFSDLE